MPTTAYCLHCRLVFAADEGARLACPSCGLPLTVAGEAPVARAGRPPRALAAVLVVAGWGLLLAAWLHGRQLDREDALRRELGGAAPGQGIAAEGRAGDRTPVYLFAAGGAACVAAGGAYLLLARARAARGGADAPAPPPRERPPG
jgi:hypothetical protein